MYKPGDKITIRTAQGPELAIILKPRAEHLPLPGPQWHIIRFAADGAVLCVHEQGFRAP